MDAVSNSTVTNASAADLGTFQGVAAVSVLKKALNHQESTAALLLQGLPQPALATEGSLGTQVNTYA